MTTPSGWYDDGHGATRWWDGAQWTEHVAAPADAVPVDVAPTPPTKSKLWIVWVVLGLVVVGVLVVAAVFIPRLIVGLLGQGGQPAGADADQRAAVDAVQLYDSAWQNSDCDAYRASTSGDFREQSGLTDCSAFETEAEAFHAAADDYAVTVVDVRQEGDTILVGTTETYTLLLDEAGQPLDEPSAESIDWVYVMIAHGDDWVIDDMQ